MYCRAKFFNLTDFLLHYRVVNSLHIVKGNFGEINHAMDVEHLDTFPPDHEVLHDEVIHLLGYKRDQ